MSSSPSRVAGAGPARRPQRRSWLLLALSTPLACGGREPPTPPGAIAAVTTTTLSDGQGTSVEISVNGIAKIDDGGDVFAFEAPRCDRVVAGALQLIGSIDGNPGERS